MIIMIPASVSAWSGPSFGASPVVMMICRAIDADSTGGQSRLLLDVVDSVCISTKDSGEVRSCTRGELQLCRTNNIAVVVASVALATQQVE